MNAPKQVPQEVIDALMRGDKMAAIKLVRELTGNDLKSALEMVQQVAERIQATKSGHAGPHQVSETAGQRQNRERTQTILSEKHTPTVMPGDSGGRGVFWLLLIAAAAVGVWLFGQ